MSIPKFIGSFSNISSILVSASSRSFLTSSLVLVPNVPVGNVIPETLFQLKVGSQNLYPEEFLIHCVSMVWKQSFPQGIPKETLGTRFWVFFSTLNSNNHSMRIFSSILFRTLISYGLSSDNNRSLKVILLAIWFNSSTPLSLIVISTCLRSS